MRKRPVRQVFDHDGEPLLSAKEAARRLDLNVETIRRWVRKGAVPYVEKGPYKRRWLRQCDVEAQRRYCGAA